MNIKLTLCTLLLSSSAFAQIDSGLVAYYKLDGNAGDSSGNGNHGVVTGTITATDRFGNAGKAYRFVNDDDQISSNLPISINLATAAGLSVSAWVYIDSLTYHDARIANLNNDIHDAGVLNFELVARGTWVPAADQGKGHWLNYDGSQPNPVALTSAQSAANGQWFHLVATWDRSTNTEKIYFNSSLTGQQNSIATTFTLKNITLGRHPDEARCLRGALDDVRIYNRSLSQADVTELYNQATAIGERHSLALDASIYPNPVKDMLNINISDENKTKAVVMIYDLMGKEMMNNAFSEILDISSLNGGMYIIKIMNTETQATFTEKLIKQ